MTCDHVVVQQLGPVTWCPRCGAVRVGTTAAWRLPESEQREVREAAICPICEFGDPLPVEVKDDHKIWRWSCGHWIDSRTADRLRQEEAR